MCSGSSTITGSTMPRRERPRRCSRDSLDWADHWFHHHENVEKLRKYNHDLKMVEKPTTSRWQASRYQRERTWEARRLAEADRKTLIAPISRPGPTTSGRTSQGLATAEQRAAVRPDHAPVDLTRRRQSCSPCTACWRSASV